MILTQPTIHKPSERCPSCCSGADILDSEALEAMGHTPDEVVWLLRRAVRGTAEQPYLTRDEYERLLVDLMGDRR